MSRLGTAGLLLVALLATGCGGVVANSTTDQGAAGGANGPATSTGNAGATPTSASSPRCSSNGIDSSVTDRGAADVFSEGANVAGSTTPDGLKIVDLKEGTGAVVQSGQCITVQYTGWLTDGTKFDSSRDRVGGFQLVIGSGAVIPGWDKGIPGMKAGGRRRLEIPPALGYGAQAQGPIPANSTLVFIIEVVRVV